MNIFELFKSLFSDICSLFKPTFIKRNLYSRFNKCVFYNNAEVDKNSNLGEYVVLFEYSKIVNSNLGDHTFVQKNSIICNSEIGKFCSIASNVQIGLGNHPLKMVSTHPAFYAINQPLAKTFVSKDAFTSTKKVIIGHDVWIGHGVLVKGGITIGNGAVVGAGSVVTKNVEPYAIVAGIPAKNIAYRFSSEIISSLNKTTWWDKDEQWLQNNAKLFEDPLLLLKI